MASSRRPAILQTHHHGPSADHGQPHIPLHRPRTSRAHQHSRIARPDYRRTIDSLDACRGVPSVEAALEYVGTLSQDQLPCPHHPFIAGGGQIYRECLEKGLVDEVYLTLVHARYPDADTFFPLEYLNTWQEVSRESHASADGTSPSFDYLRLIPPAEK